MNLVWTPQHVLDAVAYGAGRRGQPGRHAVEGLTNFGAPLLRADSDASYGDRLVTTLDSARFQAWRRQESSRDWTPPTGVELPGLSRVFGEVAPQAAEALRLVEMTLAVQRSAAPPGHAVPTPDPFDLLLSPEVPAVAGRLLVERMYAEIELLAMACALHRGRRLATTRATRLVGSLTRHLRAGARLLTLVPGLTVPVDLVPGDDALDLDTLRAQETSARLNAERRRPGTVAHLFSDS